MASRFRPHTIGRLCAATVASLTIVGGAAGGAVGAQQLQVAPGLNGAVSSIAGPDANGTMYIGGYFTAVNAWDTGGGAALSQATGAVNVQLPKVGGSVNAVAPDGSGGEFIGGTFNCLGGDARTDGDCTDTGEYVRRGLAHIRADGTVDPSWNPNVDGTVYALAVTGTAIYVGGEFTGMNGAVDRINLAKVSATGDGTVDPSWNPNADQTVYALAVAGTDIYVGGHFTVINGSTARNYLAKIPLAGDGTVDPSWNPNASGEVKALAVAGTDIYVGGYFTTMNGSTARNNLAKIPLAGDGTVNPSWDPNANHGVNAVAVSDTDVYVGGIFDTINGSATRNQLAKISAEGNGTVDPLWDPNVSGGASGGGDGVQALAVSGNDFYVAGDFTTMNGSTTRTHLAKIPLAGNGTVDPSWDSNTNTGSSGGGMPTALAVVGTQVYVGGTFTRAGGITRNRLAAIDQAGVLTPWNPNANGVVTAVAVSGDNAYVGGDFSTINGSTPRNHLAKISIAGNGAVDPAWNPNTDDRVSSIVVAGADVYAGGYFTTINGSTPRRYLAKIPAAGDGTIDPSWNPTVNGAVSGLAVSGTDLFEAGAVGSGRGPDLFKVPMAGEGTIDPSWNPDTKPSNYANFTALATSGTDVYVGGHFTTIDGSTATTNLAKISAEGNGVVNPSWAPNPDCCVHALAASQTGVYFATTGNGSSQPPFLAKVSTTGAVGAQPLWHIPVSGASALAVSGTNLYMGGTFATVGGIARPYLAQIGTDGMIGAAIPTVQAMQLRIRCVRRVCTTTGPAPGGAARMVQWATVVRAATSPTLARAKVRAKTGKGRCHITRSGTSTRAKRTFSCTMKLPKGTWAITTRGVGVRGKAYVAQSRKVSRVK